MTQPIHNVRLAAISSELDWSHRTRTSEDNFDLSVARAYIEQHVASSLERMEEAARMGADLVLAPEYFEGSELFTTTHENKRLFVDDAKSSSSVEKLKTFSGRHGIYAACAFHLLHDDRLIQTGVLTSPRGELVGMQIKNTCMPVEQHPDHTYELFDLDVGKTGIFTCSDCTTYSEDPLSLAKQGMALMLVPGCGFAGPHWMDYLKVRALDLQCVVAYSDGDRAAIVLPNGTVACMTGLADRVVFADVAIPVKSPADRVRGYCGEQ